MPRSLWQYRILKTERNIRRKKDVETGICGKCLAGHEDDVPRLSEGAVFMSPTQFVSIVEHPYVAYGYEEYQHFLLSHSIREDHRDGFLIPYKKVMEYAAEHPEFDAKSVFVFAPDDFLFISS